jgi:DNA-binding MarR family transcriptional regulator
VRSLRRGLGLDSGYVSRLLHSLEAARLVTVARATPTSGSRPRA